MLTTCLIVLILVREIFTITERSYALHLQVRQLLRVLFLCYLVTCVFLYLVIILSQYYYFPNSLCLVPVEILHNNTQARLNYLIKICLTAAGYPVITLKGARWYLKPFKRHRMRLLRHNCILEVSVLSVRILCQRTWGRTGVLLNVLANDALIVLCCSRVYRLTFWPKKLALVMLTPVKTHKLFVQTRIHHLFSQAVMYASSLYF